MNALILARFALISLHWWPDAARDSRACLKCKPQTPTLPPPLPRMGLLMSHRDSHQQPRSFMAVRRAAAADQRSWRRRYSEMTFRRFVSISSLTSVAHTPLAGWFDPDPSRARPASLPPRATDERTTLVRLRHGDRQDSVKGRSVMTATCRCCVFFGQIVKCFV